MDDQQAESALKGPEQIMRTKRRYGASCELCRRRKRKCPGRDNQGNSLCTHCAEVGVKCVFPPNGSFLRAKKAVAVVNSISSSPEVDVLQDYIRHLAAVDDKERQRMLDQWIDDHGPKDAVRKSPLRFSSPTRAFSPDDDEVERKVSPHDSKPTSVKNSRPFKKPRLWADTSPSVSRQRDANEEDDEGHSEEKALRLESALRLSLKPATPEDSEFAEDKPPIDRSIQSTTVLQANISAWVDYWVAIPFPGGIIAQGPSPEDRKLLFDNYFCWQGPRNGIVDRAIFERALEENDSKYYSPFLLYAICAHTVRHIPQLRDRVHEYAAKAHYLLAAELSRPSSIPTAQGLMLLASHDAARGMYAQAWNLTSTAIAMMMDLGCHLDRQFPVSLDRNDLQREHRTVLHKQMRLRLFWSSFIWDKLISLALNRTPLLNSEEHAPPYPETTSSSELWVPVLCTDSPPALFSYVPQRSHELKCLYETCRANQFLDEIHRKLYRTKKVRSLQDREFVERMRERITQWEKEASPDVMLDFSGAPIVHPPPPHIMQLNLTRHILWILLYRPFFYSSTSAGQSSPSFAAHAIPTCERAAIEINEIFILYDRFYPLSRASYIVIFAGFLQATVDLALADQEKSVSGPTLSRLALAGRVLSGGSANIPGMHSSVRSLQEHLHATLSRCNSWTPSSKSRKGSDQSVHTFSQRATSVTTCVSSKDSQNISSPSPPMSNQRSSTAPPDPQSGRALTMSSVSNIPSDESELSPLSPPHYLPPVHTLDPASITGHLSPSDAAIYNLPSHHHHQTNSETIYQGTQTSYIPQTPDRDVVDYMAGSQVSHYESGWNAWFWPGADGGAHSTAGSMAQNPHVAIV
jgi:hypothetical protein